MEGFESLEVKDSFRDVSDEKPVVNRFKNTFFRQKRSKTFKIEF